MEDELRLSLLVLGGCFIIGVLVHGLWVNRKNKHDTADRKEPESWHDSVEDADDDQLDDIGFSAHDDTDIDDLDELGLGKPRVVSSAPAQPQETLDTNEDVTDDPLQSEDEPDVEATPEEVKLYGSVVTQPKPHLAQHRGETGTNKDAIPEPPGFLLQEEGDTVSMGESNPTQSKTGGATAPENTSIDADVSPEPDFQLNAPAPAPKSEKAPSNVTSLSEQAKKLVTRKKPKAAPRKRQEPKLGEDQMHIDFNEPDVTDEPVTKDNSTASLEQEVLVLNVKAPDDSPIAGAALLPMLLTLGFKFGDQDIFHRHVNSNGKGPVLFSLANMFKPGVFDIDNLENFTTQGISLFMILPIDDPHQVFNMMHNAARKIADEFGAQVLDGRRSVLTKQGLQQYVEKIRDFERRRMISR